jgi:hypothetical protein
MGIAVIVGRNLYGHNIQIYSDLRRRQTDTAIGVNGFDKILG